MSRTARVSRSSTSPRSGRPRWWPRRTRSRIDVPSQPIDPAPERVICVAWAGLCKPRHADARRSRRPRGVPGFGRQLAASRSRTPTVSASAPCRYGLLAGPAACGAQAVRVYGGVDYVVVGGDRRSIVGSPAVIRAWCRVRSPISASTSMRKAPTGCPALKGHCSEVHDLDRRVTAALAAHRVLSGSRWRVCAPSVRAPGVSLAIRTRGGAHGGNPGAHLGGRGSRDTQVG